MCVCVANFRGVGGGVRYGYGINCWARSGLASMLINSRGFFSRVYFLFFSKICQWKAGKLEILQIKTKLKKKKNQKFIFYIFYYSFLPFLI